MEIYDVIVIGGGAAGCMAAISAGRLSKKVLIIEKNEKLEKKIYATGNGKCNFTNDFQEAKCYRSTHPKKAFDIINLFNKDRTLTLLKELGILSKNKNGYYYPYSEQASSVAEAFILELKVCGVKDVCGTFVKEVVRCTNNVPARFLIETDKGEYYGHAVIISTGGMASPVHGSDGSGYKIAEGLGHKLISPLPALTQLKGKGVYQKTTAGVRIEGKGTLYIDNKKEAEEIGEFLFTSYGISGIPVLQMSRFASRALEEGKQVSISLDFFPDYDKKEFSELLIDKYIDENHKTIEEVLHCMINYKLAYAVLMELKIHPEALAKNISNNDIKRIAESLKRYIINIIGTNGFDNAQCSLGGVSLNEINEKTMESLIMSGVYFAGEILDVDGTCGGYNLQWAFTSGYIAGRAAAAILH